MTIDDIHDEEIISRYTIRGHRHILQLLPDGMYCWFREDPMEYTCTDIYDPTVEGAIKKIKEVFGDKS